MVGGQRRGAGGGAEGQNGRHAGGADKGKTAEPHVRNSLRQDRGARRRTRAAPPRYSKTDSKLSTVLPII
ncbi:hypothetical protein GCM10023322_77130 [Rugosimonospora acidiphila]|uniref:Uncharacterized protein n=1 Tax=Rugosimonospora acidiphila TaxID=556531 RepID=A0ABP9SRS0_9ACTN